MDQQPSMAEQFFKGLSHDKSVRQAVTAILDRIDAQGPMTVDQINEVMNTDKTWMKLIEVIGERVRPIFIQQIQYFATDVKIRLLLRKIIEEIESNGPFSDDDFQSILRQELPPRMMPYVKHFVPPEQKEEVTFDKNKLPRRV
jgi:hypothetical protein